VTTQNGQKGASRGLLILHPGALGDVVATFPAILELRRRFRPVSLLCQGHIAALAARLGVIDVPLALESAGFAALYGAPGSLRAGGRLRPCRHMLVFSACPELAVTLRRCLPGAALHRMAPRPPPDLNTHVLQHLYDQLAACGLLTPAVRPAPAAGPFRAPSPHPSPPGGDAPILLHPGAGSPRKRWPLPYLLAVAAGLEARRLQPAFLLGPAEQDLAARLQAPQHPKRPIHRVADLAALQQLLETAGGLIGNDSGVSHLSAFLGLPTVAVFGPSSARRWAPSGPAAAAVQPALDCRPCFETNPANCEGAACLHGTLPETVLETFLGLYTRGYVKKEGGGEVQRKTRPHPTGRG
jgi:ADP-heptose:LPS heptosyltransferase